jgi:hypothetical protein
MSENNSINADAWRRAANGRLRVAVTGINNNQTGYSVTSKTTVDDFMKMIARKLGLQGQSFSVMRLGKQLEPGHVLSDYDLRKDALFLMVASARGG